MANQAKRFVAMVLVAMVLLGFSVSLNGCSEHKKTSIYNGGGDDDTIATVAVDYVATDDPNNPGVVTGLAFSEGTATADLPQDKKFIIKLEWEYLDANGVRKVANPSFTVSMGSLPLGIRSFKPIDGKWYVTILSEDLNTTIVQRTAGVTGSTQSLSGNLTIPGT